MPRWSSVQGFTLIELLVTIALAGILAAIALPSYLNQRQKAHEADAIVQMRGEVPKLMEYALENGSFPGDVGPGVAPAGVEWNLDGNFDYDNWQIGNTCLVQITWFGPNHQIDRPSSSDSTGGNNLQRYVDDVILVVNRASC